MELESRTNEIKQHLIELWSELEEYPRARLLAVSKNFPASDIRIAHSLGQKSFAENRVQELLAKQAELATLSDISWHLIGTLQANKVRKVVGKVELIHSVSSVALLERIERIAGEEAVKQDLLLQVKLAKDDNKQGLGAEEVLNLCKLHWDNVVIRGLMCIAPNYDNKEEAKAVFMSATELWHKMRSVLGEQCNILSMGMSGDYKYALECGATHIRIGSQIFGKRIYK